MNEEQNEIERQWLDLVIFAKEGTKVLPEGFTHDAVDAAYLRALLALIWRTEETAEREEKLQHYKTLYRTDKLQLRAVHEQYRRLQALYRKTDALTTQLTKGEITDKRALLLALCDLCGLLRGEEGGTTAGVIFEHAARVLLETSSTAAGAKKELPKKSWKPTPEEVAAYMRSYCDKKGVRFSETEAEKCYDQYQANGWKQSNGNRITDWKAAVRNWVRRIPEFRREQQKQSVYGSEASYDLEEFARYAVGTLEWEEREKRRAARAKAV